ncbi:MULTISPECIES: prephenate dehydratase [Hymenobacter]|uniref:prephenate dehydratase n=1 Tax=Hymenobacter mucosus TaxID=1411120 RepID=A0A238X1F0_9BACT|nr:MULTISPECIES: prephenate dehydratase [Hymenobacter]SNR52490.1 prephenate dehydratase [Hymenobacter mucosus]
MLPTVAIQGFEGSFHQIAARHYFGPTTQTAPCATFGDVIRQVAEGQTDAAVMAIENSIAGSILPNYTLLRKSGLRVMGEVYLRIQQHLLALPGQQLTDIREVHSHPMALLQCTDFLVKQPTWRLVETEDTALSARRIREGHQTGIAAIAGQLAAELFDLDIIAPSIQTEKKNYTRFLVIAKPENALAVEQPNKASLYFHTSHAQGSLARVLVRIADLGINLSKLQSFPKPGSTWNYYFHADLEFDHPDQFEAALREMQPVTESVQVLGVYHKGTTH